MRIDFSELTPDSTRYLGQVAYLQLGFFQRLSHLVSDCGSVADKEAVALAAGAALAKHQAVVAEITRKGLHANELMAPFEKSVDGYLDLISGASLSEKLVSVYICHGFLDDFFVSLAAGLPSDIGPRIGGHLGADSGEAAIVAILNRAIEADPRRAHFLALWGRRLVGDTLLFARAALQDELDATSAGLDTDDERIEPVFTELIATHTRRMDALGLTA